MNNEEVASMMYPFMTLNDDTEITHSETLPDGRVRVYIETPDEKGGFRSATCWLPDYRWEGVCGYTASEMSCFKGSSATTPTSSSTSRRMGGF